MTNIRITKKDSHLFLYTPYHPDLPQPAREIGGRWNGEAWVFDTRDEDRVRALAKSIYGWVEDASGRTVTVRLTLDSEDAHRKAIWVAGREVATRRWRDSDVMLGEKTVIAKGHFSRSGGSRANPALGACRGLILEVRDIPAEAVSLVEEAWGDAAEIIPDENTPTPDRDRLLEERARLQERLAEIDALLTPTTHDDA